MSTTEILLRSKLNSLENNLNEFLEQYAKMNNIVYAYMNLKNPSEYEHITFMEEYNEMYKEVCFILEEMRDVFNNKHLNSENQAFCHFRGYCELCTGEGAHLSFDFCLNICSCCAYYRKRQKQDDKKEYHRIYNEHIKPKINPNDKITNYINTKDLFFHVLIIIIINIIIINIK